MYARIGHTAGVAAWMRISMLLVATAAGWACRQPPIATTSRGKIPRLLEAKADTGITMRVLLLRDTVAAADSAAVEVVYAIVNGPRPTRFDNDPGRYRILVIGSDGEPATSLGGAGPVFGSLGRQPEMVLPARGSLVQRQDLRCVNDAAYSNVPFSPSKNTCLAMYAFTTPGDYRVIVDYFGPEPDSVLAAAERGRARGGQKPPYVPGLHLADTVTLVVTPR